VRIALIGPVPPRLGGLTPGGVATHQMHLAEGLAAAGIGVALLATNTCTDAGTTSWHNQTFGTAYTFYRMPRSAGCAGWPAPPTFAGICNLMRYAPRVVAMRNFGSRAEVLRNTLIYRDFLAEVRPDLIHVQHPLERCTYARLVRRIERWRVPLVVTAHSLFGEHDDATIHELMAPNLRAAERVIAVSDHIADQAIELGVEPARIRVIRSGVDTSRFQGRDRGAARQRLDVRADACLVLFVGNLEPRKQVDVLLHAVAQARKQPQLALLQVLIVGTGESAGAQDQTFSLHRLCDELGLTDIVHFAGRLADEQLLDAYAAADVFVLPSSSEAQGIVALEAMAAGLPVVATAVGGLRATIEDDRTGFLVPPGDSAALGRRLIQVLSDSARRAAIGAAAREAVATRFAWPRAVDATIDLYREVLR
jgi:glycosyltransferase involved in cell wall biosynthesis